VFHGPSTESLILMAGSMARLTNDTEHVLTRVCVPGRLPGQQVTVPLVQESLELQGVVEGLQLNIAPLTAPFVVAVVKRNEAPNAVIVGVDHCHEPTVDLQRVAGRAVARAGGPGVPQATKSG
jgi:hypothetical protein